MQRFRPVMLAALMLAAVPLGAQTPARADDAQAEAAHGRVWTEGWHAGHAAAGAPPVGGRMAAAFLGGLPIGFFGLVAVTQGDGVPVVGAAAGAVAVGFALMPGRAELPDALAAEAAGRGPTYERAFTQSYAERLTDRRRGAALAGGVTGVATGFGLLILLVSRLGT